MAADPVGLAAAIDAGQGLEDEQHRGLLDCAAGAAAEAGDLIPAVAAAPPHTPAPPRVVLLTPTAYAGPLTIPNLCEQYLVPGWRFGRRGVVVLYPEDLKHLKKRRAPGSMPEGVSYHGNGSGGRVNFLPSARNIVAIIGKSCAAYIRRSNDEEMQITVHEVKRVLPAAAPSQLLSVDRIEVAANGMATVHTHSDHPFSGAKQLVSVQGLGAELDGSYAVQKKVRGSRTAFQIKLPRPAALNDFQREVDAQVAAAGVKVSEQHELDSSWVLVHLMVTAPAQPPAEQPAHLLAQPANGAAGQPHDAREKERVRAFDEGEKAVAIAADICTFIYSYKGCEAQRLGVMAQQVRQVLERHGVRHTSIVKEDAQGRLSVDYGALQVLLLAALKHSLADSVELKQAHSTMQLTVMGRIEEIQAAVKALQAGSRPPSARGAAGSRQASGSSKHSSGTRLGSGQAGEGDAGESDGEMSDDSDLSVLLDCGDVDMSSASGEEEGEGAEQPCPEEQAGETESHSSAAAARAEGELAGLRDDEAVTWLMQRLGEQPTARKVYTKLASQLSRAALWEVYREAVTGPQELTAAGDRRRTPGGQFLKLAKKRVSEEEVRRATQASQPFVLRAYQRRAVDVAASGRNIIFVLPTGAGKTAIPVALSERMLERDPAARIVFLAPYVPLVGQQTAFFLNCPSFQSGMFRVTGRTSDNSIAPRDWPKVVEEHHVLVMTPQLLLNMLDVGVAHFDQISLLVLDECHHAQRDHSMAKVMRHYRNSARTTQVLGLTASPASKATLDDTFRDLRQLQFNLDAEYYVLDESDAELKAVIPDLQYEEVLVDSEPLDDSLGRRLGAFVVAAVARLHRALGLPEAARLPREVTAILQAGRWCSTAARWTVTAAEALQAGPSAAAAGSSTSGHASQPAAGGTGEASRHDATSALLLVRAAVAALALVTDIGFEAAIRYLSQEYYRVAATVASAGGSGSSLPLTAALLQQVAADVEQADVLAGAYSLEAGTLSRHPKFAALKAVLLRYRERDGFHGIVFARTREAVRSLTALIAASPDLQFVEVYRFMGHGSRKASSGAGMTSKEQRAVMEQFKQPGRRLLVSTSAGEEGIDVPSCEFVVRYTATQTGRERVQSAGRARKMGSCFVEIIEKSPAELTLVHKSRREAQNMKVALSGLGSLLI